MKQETKRYLYGPGTYIETTFDKEENMTITFSEDQLAFIQSAINNYSGMGRERDEVLKKLSQYLTPEARKYIRKVWGHTWDRR